MKRIILSLVAICATTVPAFCGAVNTLPEPKSSSWIYGVALAGVAAFAFFKRPKGN